MKRMHLHVGVADLDQAVRFYATLFGAQPSVRKDDYAKWMLDDPRVNFAISTHSAAPGLDHIGIQAESGDELADITARLKAADASILQQEATTCCYARSDKTWVQDPSGLRWETFYTHGEATTYGADASTSFAPVAPQLVVQETAAANSSCCG
jgi:catechol 2,3-dioxygenase-like lactoylglutathione lyase family enzyme